MFTEKVINLGFTPISTVFSYITTSRLVDVLVSSLIDLLNCFWIKTKVTSDTMFILLVKTISLGMDQTDKGIGAYSI